MTTYTVSSIYAALECRQADREICHDVPDALHVQDRAR
jgi:hypothetical protein